MTKEELNVKVDKKTQYDVDVAIGVFRREISSAVEKLFLDSSPTPKEQEEAFQRAINPYDGKWSLKIWSVRRENIWEEILKTMDSLQRLTHIKDIPAENLPEEAEEKGK